MEEKKPKINQDSESGSNNPENNIIQSSKLLRVSSTVILILYLISVLALGLVYCAMPSRKTQLINARTFWTEIFQIYFNGKNGEN